MKLSPSLLSADFSRLDREVQEVEKAGAQYLHLDIMDGHFVPNISFGAPVISSLRAVTKMVFDVHLMIEHPEKYIPSFAKAGADIITVHAEACENLKETLDLIEGFGVKPAVTMKPNTEVSAIEEVLDRVSLVLIMTVEPGFGGQKLIPSTLDKVSELAEIREKNGYCYEIEVDGGISLETAPSAIEAGADVLVAGSAVFGGPEPGKRVQGFLDLFKEYDKK